MKVTVGLGNPGKEYEKTRHNVGFLFLDHIQKKRSMPQFSNQKKLGAEITKQGDEVLIKPQLFMNISGKAVRNSIDYYIKNWQTDSSFQLCVAHDDLDLEFGTFKIQYGTGPKVHNGLLSLYQHLQSKNFWHLRIGVDSRAGERTMSGSDYVLSKFKEDQLIELEHIFDKVLIDLENKL